MYLDWVWDVAGMEYDGWYGYGYCGLSTLGHERVSGLVDYRYWLHDV